MRRAEELVLTLSCRLLAKAAGNLIDSQPFGDVRGEDATGLIFMRVHFAAAPHLAQAAMREKLSWHVRSRSRMDARGHAVATRPWQPRMVGKADPRRPGRAGFIRHRSLVARWSD